MRQRNLSTRLEALADEFRGSDDTVIAVLQVGSQAVDLDTPTSDTDLLAIVERDVSEHHFVDVDDVVVDIGVIGSARLERLWERISGPWTAETYADLYEEKEALALLGRLHTGRVLKGSDAIAEFRSRMSAGRVARALQIHYALRAATYMRDAVGSVLAEEWETADDTSSSAARLIAQMLLAGVDDLYVGDKFTRRRLERNEALGALAPLMRSALIASTTPSRSGVEERLQVCSAVAGFVSLYAPEGGLDADSIDDFAARLRAADAAPWSCSGSVLVPLDEGLYLAGIHNIILDPEHVVAWFSRLISSPSYPATMTALEMAGVEASRWDGLVEDVDAERETYEGTTIDESQLALVTASVDGSWKGQPQ